MGVRGIFAPPPQINKLMCIVLLKIVEMCTPVQLWLNSNPTPPRPLSKIPRKIHIDCCDFHNYCLISKYFIYHTYLPALAPLCRMKLFACLPTVRFSPPCDKSNKKIRFISDEAMQLY